MMAVLVLAHPDDTKFKEWIGRLQIQWMMLQDPKGLSVNEGFWKGITTQNLKDVFSAAPAHDIADNIQLEYSRIFGEDFKACQEDIREYVPAHLQEKIVPLENGQTDDEAEVPHSKDGEACADQGVGSTSPLSLGPDINSILGDDALDTDSDAVVAMDADSDAVIVMSTNNPSAEKAEGIERPEIPKDLEQEFREHLGFRCPSQEVAPATLEEWLIKLINGADKEASEHFRIWLTTWSDRVDAAETLVDQVILRELFLQSLRRLHSLHGLSMPSMAAAHMLVDMWDFKPVRYRFGSPETAKRQLQIFPEYTTYVNVTTLLQQEINKDPANKLASSFLQTFARSQILFFHDLATGNSSLADYCQDVINIETMRTLTLLHCLQEIPGSKGKGRDWGWEGLDSGVISTVHLSNSQRRLLVLRRADRNLFLTKCQSECFQQLVIHPPELRAPQCPPLPVFPPLPSEGTTAIQRHLHSLLGDLAADQESARWLTDTSTTSWLQARRPSRRPQSTTPARQRSTSRPASKARGSMTPTIRSAFAPQPDAQPATSGQNSPRWPPNTPNSVPVQNGATTSRPGSHSQYETPHHTPSESSAAPRSAFAGKTRIPIKRPSDEDHGSRASKAPRLSFAEEVTMSVDKTKNELLQAVKELKEDLYTGSGVRLSSEAQSSLQRLEAVLLRLEEARDSAVSKTNLHDVATRLMSRGDALSSDVREGVSLLKSELASIKTDTASAVKDLIRGKMHEVMDALNESKRQPAPALGDDGYLMHNCPAPAGWDQSWWVGRLERAAWWYIWEFWRLGDPDLADDDNGVSEDEMTIEATKARFPDLPEPAIIIALKHIHVRTFRQPLRAGQVEEVEDDAEEEEEEAPGDSEIM